MKFASLTLHTPNLESMRQFYNRKLGFPVLSLSDSSFSVKAGNTVLTFMHAPEAGFYHLAFNIPSDLIKSARNWVKDNVPPIPLDQTGQLIAEFTAWNARAVYFEDPDKNILEFIARKNLNIEGEAPFTPRQIVGISEIGLPVENVKAQYEELKEDFGLEIWKGDAESFCAIGDEEGLFITVPFGRNWYPTNRPAVTSPLSVRFYHQGRPYSWKVEG